MTTLLQRWRGDTGAGPAGLMGRDIATVDDYIAAVNQFAFNGNLYGLPGVQQTLGGEQAEKIGTDLVGLASAAYAGNGPVFSLMMVRQLVFSMMRLQWQRLINGKPSETFGTRQLSLFERPAGPGTTTQSLASRAIQDVDLTGNWFATNDVPLLRVGGDDQPEIVRLRPDWVQIVLEKRVINGGHVGWRKAGWLYWEGGVQSGNEPTPFLVDEVAHWAPYPDPLASYRGMTWLTPIIRELQNDKLMGRHQRKFFENGATPNIIVTMPKEMPEPVARRWAAFNRENQEGVDNAYKTWYIGGGADASMVGRDMRQMDFHNLQGRGETRLAAAAGVPPVIAGFSEGLAAATYSNYGQARRRLADGTMHPLWADFAGSIEPLATKPPPRPGEDSTSVRLTYDVSGNPFLREDSKDAAEIQRVKATTIRQYVDAGFTPESAVAAVEAEDPRLLVHTGLFSVQLQPAGQNPSPKEGDNGAA